MRNGQTKTVTLHVLTVGETDREGQRNPQLNLVEFNKLIYIIRNMQFTQDELKNIGALINLAPIKGQDALTVALLQQKIASLITPKEEKNEKGTTSKQKS